MLALFYGYESKKTTLDFNKVVFFQDRNNKIRMLYILFLQTGWLHQSW